MMQSRKLLNFANLKHGFTTKSDGNMNLQTPDGCNLLSRKLRINFHSLVGFQQVHGSRVLYVDDDCGGSLVSASDGGITREKNLLLAVNTADCVPVLFLDPVRETVGAIHAGWRGIVAGIISSTIELFIAQGSAANDLLVVIGPHIGGCCYTILPDRMEFFFDRFGKNNHMIYAESGIYHLELGEPIILELIRCGVTKKNIDYIVTCTYCQNQDFYSYRRDKSLVLGKMAAFIGIYDGKN